MSENSGKCSNRGAMGLFRRGCMQMSLGTTADCWASPDCVGDVDGFGRGHGKRTEGVRQTKARCRGVTKELDDEFETIPEEFGEAQPVPLCSLP